MCFDVWKAWLMAIPRSSTILKTMFKPHRHSEKCWRVTYSQPGYLVLQDWESWISTSQVIRDLSYFDMGKNQESFSGTWNVVLNSWKPSNVLKRARYHQDLSSCLQHTYWRTFEFDMEAGCYVIPARSVHPHTSCFIFANITGGVNVSDCVLNYNTLSGNKTVLSAIYFFIIVPVY